MMQWMAAYGAFHGADAIVFYQYNDDFESWEKDMQEGFYNLHRNASQMALSPMFAYAYRHGLIAEASNPLELTYSPEYMVTAVPLTDNSGRWGTHIPYNSRLALTTAIRTTGFDGTGAPDFSVLPAGPGLQATTSTGETSIDAEQGILTTVTPEFVSITGFLNENGTHEAGPLKVVAANDYAAVTLLSLTGEPISEATESVLTVSSRVQNTNMTWNGNSVNNSWGQQPTEVLPIELSLNISHATKNYLQVFRLSPTGAEESYKVVFAPDGNFSLTLDQSDGETMWYGLEFSTIIATKEPSAVNSFTLSSNPASVRSFAEVALKSPSPISIRLLNAQGGLVKIIYQNQQPVQAVREAIEVGGLAAGIYFVECKAGDWVTVERLVVK